MRSRGAFILPARATCRGLAAGLLLTAIGSGSWAAEREHDAHEHGVGQLNVAVEGEEVEIELVAPGADIVGFEHEATSEADKAAIASASEALADGDALFIFPAEAECRLEEAEVESGLLEDHDEHEEHDEHEKHDEHEGEDEHAHEDEHGHEGEHEDEETHAEFHAHYHFECEAPEALKSVELRYFERFPNAEELEAQVITDSGQSAQELTAGSNRLDL